MIGQKPFSQCLACQRCFSGLRDILKSARKSGYVGFCIP